MELGRDALARGTCFISGPLLPASDFEITSNHHNSQYGVVYMVFFLKYKTYTGRIGLAELLFLHILVNNLKGGVRCASCTT
jgi:hypothetical protein